MSYNVSLGTVLFDTLPKNVTKGTVPIVIPIVIISAPGSQAASVLRTALCSLHSRG